MLQEEPLAHHTAFATHAVNADYRSGSRHLLTQTGVLHDHDRSATFSRTPRRSTMASAQATIDNASDLDTLHRLNRNYVRSVEESDVRWFDEHLAADFLNSNPDGTLVD